MEYFSPPLPPEAEEDKKKTEETSLSDKLAEEEVNSGFHEIMRELLSSPEEEDDEEEEDTEDSKKKKKRKGFLDFFRGNKVARRTIENESSKEPKEPKEEAPNFAEGLPSLLDIEADEKTEEPKEAEEKQQDEEEIATQEPSGLEENNKESLDASEITESSLSDSDTPEEENETDLVPPDIPPGTTDSVIPPIRPEEGSVNTQPEPASETVVNNITNIENHPNNVAPALVGSLIVDQLSRHRDRKIRREAEALKERTKEQESQRKAVEQELQKKQRQVKESVERLRQAREKDSDHKSQPDRHSEKSVEPKNPQHNAEQVKKAEEKQFEAPKRLSTDDIELDKAAEIKPKMQDKGAELVLEQVEAAAERGIAIENQYEKSHEIKDEPTRGAQANFGSQTIAQHTINNQVSDDIAGIQQSLRQRQIDDFAHARSTATKQQLKTAALLGVLTGAVVIAIIIVMMLLG